MHRWLSNDVNDPETDASDSCYACGVAVDYPRGSWNDTVQWLMPPCKPGNPDRAHHYVLELVSDGAERVTVDGIETAGPTYGDGLVCAYGDSVVTDTTEGAAVSPCVGG